ncbi:DNA-3-methyladenine glycosylase [Abyssisolibacter fermentans]|uniref:DNA-3-methyladenine glycosylase n=1 Tax=Abyssisolibacter fermentans TaxID=1766203 RepID=UPI000830F6D7|nr:DNA-3-methyladenine glycosylase [Abyssisolibacter fermentans]
MRLGVDFYQQNAVTLARQLIGKTLVRKIENSYIKCRIVETEAYCGPEDKACHAYNNKRTNRTQVMFKNGGIVYIYMIYGMYYCLNIVANKEGKPEAVLIRAVEPLDNIDIIRENRKIKTNKNYLLTNGPGKLCNALKIDKTFNGYDLIKGGELFILSSNKECNIVETKRINIDYAQEYKDKLWRFYIKDNKFISKK